jgi:hypothetical protein
VPANFASGSQFLFRHDSVRPTLAKRTSQKHAGQHSNTLLHVSVVLYRIAGGFNAACWPGTTNLSPEIKMLLSLLSGPDSFRAYRRPVSFYALLIAAVSFCPALKAQQAVPTDKDLPDAPSASGSSVPAAPAGPRQSAANGLPSWIVLKPQTPAQKFGAATQSNFSIPSLVFAAAGAGITQAQDFYPEFHQGAAGYGRYLWHGFADQTVNGYMTEFVLPVALHQDTRYYRLGYGTFWKRSAYSLSRLAVTRSDQGRQEFNTSEILGSGMAASISSTFYPERERTFSIVGQRWAGNVAGDALGLLFKEFSPEIGSALGNVVHLRRHSKAITDDPMASQSQTHP